MRISNKQWRDLIAQQKISSLSVAEFSRQHNLNPKTFYAQRSKSQTKPVLPFAKVQIKSEQSHTVKQSNNSSAIIIRHGESVIEVSAVTPAQWLADFVKLLT
jgi:hypothetical protein